nr:hypothetical protein BaRGS_017698 [Batillaria attramentaria]
MKLEPLKPVFGSHGVEGLEFVYHTAEELENFLTQISETYTQLTQLYSIGKSVNGVDLWVIAIGESPRDHVTLRPNIKYVGNMHGNEVVGREELLHLVEYLVMNYGRLDNVTHLLNTSTVHIMPTMNPDGFAKALTGPDCDNLHGRANANNYDLNRNFPDFFRVNTSPIQPETQAIMDWVHSTQFVLSGNLHGGAMVANYPFDSYLGTSYASIPHICPDNDVFVHLAKTYSLTHPTMRLPMVCPEFNFTDGITNGAQWYPLIGGMQDYNYIRAGCYEVTLEISCCKFPPANQLQAFWEADREPLLALLMKINMGVRGIVRDENNNPVKGAHVTIQGRELIFSQTTSEGEYWKLLLPGHYRLLVSVSGCDPQVIPFRVRDGVITRLDVTLNTKGAFSSATSSVVGRENLLHLIEYLVTNYGQDENISRLLNTTTVHILPDMNPDGYNANGFDLNRNFPDFFIPEKSARPIQPETRAIMDWVATTQFVLSAGLHGGALVASYPFDNYMGSDVILANRSLTSLATNTHGVIARSPDHDLLVHLARTYADPHPTMKTEAQCDMYNFTDGITNGAQWYPLTGGMQDHNYLVAGCIELSLELSCCKYPPVDELQSFWDANRQSMLDLMQKVHMGVKGLVKDNEGRPVEGVTVTVQGREMVTSRTTQHGEYWKILLPGYYRLMVSKDGCNPQTYNFQVETGSVTRLDVTYEIPDEPTGSGMRLSGTLFLGLLLPLATTVALRM